MSLLKVGGISPNQTAQPLQLGSFGEVKTTQYPSKSFYLGSVAEPVESSHIGSYGVFGVEVINTLLKDNITGGRYDNHSLAHNGNIYFIEKEGDIVNTSFYLVYYSLVSGKTKRVPIKYYQGGAFPTTIINLGKNIAITNRDGNGELYNAKTLIKIKDIAFGVDKYSKDSKTITANPNSFGRVTFREAADKTWVLSAHAITCYNDMAEQVETLSTATLFATGVYFSVVSSISVDNDYIYVTAFIKGSAVTANDGTAIVIISKATKAVVKILKDAVDLPYTLTPVAYATKDIPMLSIERTSGTISDWSVSKDLNTFVPNGVLLTLEDVSADFAVSSTSVNIVNEGNLLAVRTLTKVYLVDIQKKQLVWSIEMSCDGSTASVWFDSLGHLVFCDIDGNIYAVNKFLQVQGYGVQE